METTTATHLRWWRPLKRADRWALFIIVTIPVVLFAVPALFGHAAIAQDNLIQNFPLRVLTGQQIDSGHLPLLNPLADSGTPLLGGMNAGSFFPLTFLFAVLPALLAWVLNLIAIYVVAAFGMFALLRWHGLRTISSLAPALVYSYSGAMIGQLVHIGVVQGFALLPWAVLAMLAMASATKRTSDATWPVRLRALLASVAGLAALWGLTDLTGEPRAIAEMQLVLLVVAPVVLLIRSVWQPSTWRDRLVYVTALVVSVGWGAAIGLAQLLPGWEFIKQSQRTGLTYQWFGAGSLSVRWSSLLLIPDIFGGNGVANQPGYFVSYNLPEVTGYVGVLALVGFAAFCARFTRRGWHGDDRTWVVYVALAVVGLFATWGYYTPLGHVFRHIPLFGSTRLQSRNIIVVDLGVTVLLGWFLERLCEKDFARASLLGRRRWITLAPAMGVALLSFAMIFFGRAIVNWSTLTTRYGSMSQYEKPSLLFHLAIALSIVACLVWGLKRKQLLVWLLTLVTLDVVFFLVFSTNGFAGGNVNPEPSRASATAQIDMHGRFALVDPSGQHHDQFTDLGAPNLNVFTKLPSVQGYGSLIDELYGNVTDTHPLYQLNACQLARGVFRQLRLSTIGVSANKLSSILSPTTPPQLRCVPITRSTLLYRYFGQDLAVRAVTLRGAGNGNVSSSSVTAQLLNAKGQPFGASITALGGNYVSFDFSGFHEHGAGVKITSASGALVTSASVTVPGKLGASYQLNTAFQQALSSSQWHIVQTTGDLTFFRSTTLRSSAWLTTTSSTSRITKIRNASWGDSWITVDTTRPALLKRSMEWIPGWHATAVNVHTGTSKTLHVVRSGLIQQVVVPSGDWEVHFHYHAPLIEVGLVGSIGGIGILMLAFCYLRDWVPRRRKGRVNS